MMNEKMQNFQGEQPTYKKGGKTMKTKMKTLMKNQKGMTLIELLAVIVIIAIIALIAIPAIGNIIQKSSDKAILSDASTIISGAKIAISDGSCGDPTKDSVTCNLDVLQDYAEDADFTKDDKVVRTKDSTTGKYTYTLTYSALSKIKNKSMITKVNTAAEASGDKATTTITAVQLADAMGKEE